MASYVAAAASSQLATASSSSISSRRRPNSQPLHRFSIPFASGRRLIASPRSAAAAEASPAVTAGNLSQSSSSSFKELIESLINKVDLSEQEAEASLDLLLNEANDALISAFLVLLRAKGETFEEIVGLARAMIKNCRKVEGLSDVVDIVGTGGDGANTVNISTAAAILAAAAGAKVAKQGNRSSSSACGSADVLEALGVSIDLGPEYSIRMVPRVIQKQTLDCRSNDSGFNFD